MADILWLASYPKSGNTWTRAFLTAYLGDEDQAVDINDLEGGPIASSRWIFDQAVGIEASCLLPEEVENLRPAVYRILARDHRRTLFVKTHDAWTLTPASEPLFPADVTRGAVYIVRNPLDVAVSAAHHFGVTLDAAVAMLGDETHVLSRPAQGIGDQLPQRLRSWSGHVRSWLDESGLPVYLLRYEEMLADPVAAFGDLVRFAGLDYNPARVLAAVAACSFDSLQRQEDAAGFRERSAQATAPFFRSGRAGGWRAALTPAQVDALLAAHAATMARCGYLDAA